MQVYEVERPLPSCKVDKELLAKIERYIKDQARDVFELPEDKINSNYRLNIQESIGAETYSSIELMLRDKFSDSTKSIVLRLNVWGETTSIYLRFDQIAYMSDIKVAAEGSPAREKAVGCSDGVLRLLESCRTYAWIFHPHPLIKGAVTMLTIFSLCVTLSTVFLGSTAAIPAILAPVTVCLLIYLLGGVFNPYISFASRRAESMEKTWNWLFGGMLTFLVFGTLVVALRKRLFGF